MFSHSKKLRRWIFIWMFCFLFFFFLSLQHALITTEWLTGLRWREEEVGHARQRVIKERERRRAERTQKKAANQRNTFYNHFLAVVLVFGAQISTPTPLQKPDCVRLKRRGADFTERAQLNVWVSVKQTHICFLSAAGQQTNGAGGCI